MEAFPKQPQAAPVAAAPGGLCIADGTLEAIKWLALVLMTMDHVNKVLFGFGLPGFFEAGRVAMPLFGFVLAYNLARPQAHQEGMIVRTMRRLALSGLVALPFFVALDMAQFVWWPVDIMFTLLLATSIIALLRRGGVASMSCALLLFVAASAFVEFTWFGVGYCVAAWYFCIAPGMRTFLPWLAGAALLYFINHNFWAMAAVPVILLLKQLNIRVPRIRYAFYVYYPGHLAVLLMLKWAARQGFL